MCGTCGTRMTSRGSVVAGITISGSPPSAGNEYLRGIPFSITCSCDQYPCTVELRRRGTCDSPGAAGVIRYPCTEELRRQFPCGSSEVSVNNSRVTQAFVYSSTLSDCDHFRHYTCHDSESTSSDLYYRIKSKCSILSVSIWSYVPCKLNLM